MDQFFYGTTLDIKTPLATFENETNIEENLYNAQKLTIKRIILDPSAKENEFNIIEAETLNCDSENIRIPIAILKAGETRMLKPNIEFPNKTVSFKLIKGNGPVHIYGNVATESSWLQDD
ncbi:nucleoplasmin-like protein [Teleopsis dalmanni]|uniref:nucleoplasmin-like protein n=1 Tax=Teleopsis dalmanni TaxID=139649 RepID=UPI000D32AE79|nr:nucleoplasmin-like protein [Teleopsis dalmanni]XP_037952923.1 nucleoplasmin-like protein [Teleopsis dalmanni]